MKYLIIFCLAVFLTGSCQQLTKLSKDQPAEEYLQIGQASLYVRSIGHGPAIVIVHGGPGLGSQYLYEHLDQLADSHRLIYYDQRLAGRSSATLDSSEISFAKFVDDIDSIRAHFDLKEMHLFGHSWGGLIAMKYASKWPQRLLSLCLIDPIGASLDINQKANQKVAESLSRSDMARRSAIFKSEEFANGDSRSFEELMMIGFRVQFKDTSKAKLLHLNLPADFQARSAALQYMTDLGNYDFNRDLWNIDLPTLLIYGYEDPLRIYALQSLKENLPSLSTHILDECGHFPFIECPETFFPILRDYLSGF